MSNLKDIAQIAGVSVTTVSRILNHDPRMSAKPETRRRVFEIAEQMDYETPRARREQSRTQAANYSRARELLVATSKSAEAELEDPYYLGMRQGLTRAAAAQGYRLTFADAVGPDTRIERYGALIGIGEEGSRSLMTHAARDQVFVTAETLVSLPGAHSVTFDLAQAMDLLLDHLFDHGHRRIAMVGAEAVDALSYPASLRLPSERFRMRMAAAGLLRDRWLVSGPYSAQEGERAARALLSERSEADRPDALIARTDDMAAGVYRAVKDLGLAVGRDVSVVALNDVPASRRMTPPLTTVRLPPQIIGEAIIEVVQQAQSRARPPFQMIFCGELVTRGSVARLGMQN